MEISTVSPQGTVALLVEFAALLQSCAIMMINDSAKIPLLQQDWNVLVNHVSVDADSQNSKYVAWNILKLNHWAAGRNLPVCSISVPDSCPKPHPPFPTGVILLCTQLFSSCSGTCHLRYLTDQPQNPEQFYSGEIFLSPCSGWECIFQHKIHFLLSFLFCTNLYSTNISDADFCLG